MFHPGIKPAFQWTHSHNSFTIQHKRRTGAGFFIRSRTVQNNFLIAWNFYMPHFQVAKTHLPRTWN